MITSDDRLDSWKSIAEYLGRDRTTVMRWARTAGLPVRRVQGGHGRSVYAYRSDIDRWLAGHTVSHTEAVDPTPVIGTTLTELPQAPPRARRLQRAPILAAAAIGVLGLLLTQTLRATPTIASASLVGEEIVATDTSGRVAWRYGLRHIDGTIVPGRFLVTDLDDDRKPEVIAALHFMRTGGGHGEVILFDSRGRVRWTRSLDDHYQFGNVDYAPVWYPEDLLVYSVGGSRRIAVAYHHQTWWPGVVASYDMEGRVLGRFVNPGWVRSLNVTADGRHLLAAGINNSLGGAMLAILDAADPIGTAPDTGGSLPACVNCPRGSPVKYYVAPWSDLAQPSDTPYIAVQVDSSGRIEWRAIQRAVEHGKAPEVIVGLSPSLDVVHRGVNDYFAERHLMLERAGQLRPSHANWRQPVVRRWTPAAGWRDVQ